MYSDDFYIKSIKTYLKSRGMPDTYKDAYFQRRINVRIRKTRSNNIAGYLSFLKNNPSELEDLKKDLSINVTKFFRDVESFKYFENVLVNALKKHSLAKEKRPFQIWSAGCAIGAEPHSIAIMVDKAINKYNLRNIQVRIIATDFNDELLAIARRGVYDEAVLEDVSQEILDKYFEQTIDKNQYRVKFSVKRYIDFSHLDLTGKFSYRNLDAIICRNVLIYFASEAQSIIFKKFYDCLKTGGILFIGKTETMHLSYRGNFDNISPRHRVYFKVDPQELDDENLRKYLVCSECGLSFTREMDLKVHNKSHDKERERRYLKHLKSGSSKNVFECPQCAKKFITETRFNAHMNVFHRIITKKDRKDVY